MKRQVISNTDFLTRKKRIHKISTGYRFPSVTVFLGFNPKMEKKNKILYSLSRVLREGTSQLRFKYPGEMSELVIEKLDTIISNLNFTTNTQNLAIFVSPVFEKVYYLDIDLEERVIVNQSLQIRDLVDNKKQLNRFHILLLSKKISKIFLGSTNGLINISCESFVNRMHNETEFLGNSDFQNSPKINKASIKDFLIHVDQVLGTVLRNDGLPIVVVGDSKLATHFKRATSNGENIIEFVMEDFEKYSIVDIKKMLNSQFINQVKAKEKWLINQLKAAADINKLTYGMTRVHHESMKRGGKLLLLEKNFVGDIESNKDAGLIGTAIHKFNKFSNVKNQVDEVIEKILDNGGNVELVNKGFLKSYGPIALIKY